MVIIDIVRNKVLATDLDSAGSKYM